MQAAAAAQDYESAARLRDALGHVERASDTQQVLLSDRDDLDAIGVSSDELQANVVRLELRRGRVVGREALRADLVDDLGDAELLERFLGDLYDAERPPPREVVVDARRRGPRAPGGVAIDGPRGPRARGRARARAPAQRRRARDRQRGRGPPTTRPAARGGPQREVQGPPRAPGRARARAPPVPDRVLRHEPPPGHELRGLDGGVRRRPPGEAGVPALHREDGAGQRRRRRDARGARPTALPLARRARRRPLRCEPRPPRRRRRSGPAPRRRRRGRGEGRRAIASSSRRWPSAWRRSSARAARGPSSCRGRARRCTSCSASATRRTASPSPSTARRGGDAMTMSLLDGVDGLGPTRRERLLEAYGSVAAVAGRLARGAACAVVAPRRRRATRPRPPHRGDRLGRRGADDGAVADLLIVAGMSGAGRSTASATLEDLGWFVIDNVPAGLITRVAALADATSEDRRRLAVVIGRGGVGEVPELVSVIEDLRAEGSADQGALPRRRRRRAHPPLRGDAASAPVPGRVRRERHLPGARGAARAPRCRRRPARDGGPHVQRAAPARGRAVRGDDGRADDADRDPVVRVQVRHAPRRRRRLRLPLPAEPPLGGSAARAVRARRPRPRLRARQRRDAALRRRGDRHALLAAARLPARGEVLPHGRLRLHRRAPPLRRDRRGGRTTPRARASRPSTGTWRGERASRRRGRRRARDGRHPARGPLLRGPRHRRGLGRRRRRLVGSPARAARRRGARRPAQVPRRPRGPRLRPRHRLRAPLHAGRARTGTRSGTSSSRG